MIPLHPNDIPLKALYLGGGWNKFELTEDVEIQIPDGQLITIPKGFQTDGKSAGVFSWLFPTWGKTSKAYLLHDWMYKSKYNSQKLGYWRSRLYADKKAYQLAKELNPGKFYQWAFWDNNISYVVLVSFGWILYLKDYFKKIKL